MPVLFGKNYLITHFQDRNTGYVTPLGTPQGNQLLDKWKTQLKVRQLSVTKGDYEYVETEKLVVDPLNPVTCLYLSEGDLDIFEARLAELKSTETGFMERRNLYLNERKDQFAFGLHRIIQEMVQESALAETHYETHTTKAPRPQNKWFQPFHKLLTCSKPKETAETTPYPKNFQLVKAETKASD